MMRLPRLVSFVTVGCSFAILFSSAAIVRAQADAAAPATPAAAPASVPATAAAPALEVVIPPAGSLAEAVEDFWHYAKVGRFDMARARGNEVLAKADQPVDVLTAFEAVATTHKDNLYERLLGWQRVEPIKDVTVKILGVLNKGQEARREDPAYIQQNIERLSVNERAYGLALTRLRESGEIAVPFMIAYLQDSSKQQYHMAIRNALRDMGRLALNPLVAATEMKDPNTLTVVVTALGEIQYDAAVPYLARLAKSPDVHATVKSAVAQALVRMGAGDAANLNPAQLFYDLGEKLYYDNAAIVADNRGSMASVWYWEEGKGLTRKLVPPAIFNEIMAMRATENVLKIDPARSDAVSLWLAANYKREAELPDGAADATRKEAQPNAHYYGVAAGTRYLDPVLDRALRDHNSAVALRAIKSLEQIVGQSSLVADQAQTGPVIAALQYPDRLVRFEAAFAIATALPQKAFAGQGYVVPILAEALAQTGKPGLVIVAPKQDQINALAEILKAGYVTVGGTTADAALSNAAQLASIDAILVSDDLPAADIEHLFTAVRSSPRTARVPKVVMVKSDASAYARMASEDPLTNATKATDAAGLATALTAARQRGGMLPLDEKAALDYALRAADQLRRLAINRNTVLELGAAKASLLGALDDARPEIVKAVGEVLALFSAPEAQSALLTKALDDKTSDDLKVAAFRDLANNAKLYGNQLGQDQVASLTKAAESVQNLDVRSAAAEAHGALNLRADQVKILILNQAK